MSNHRWQRPPRRGLVAVAVLLLAAGGAATFLFLRAPRNVSHPNVEFSATTTSAAPSPAGAPFAWPLYGYDAPRTRVFADPALRPPFRRGWTYDDHALLEFPPVIYGATLFYVDDNGWVHAIDKLTGRSLWRRRAGSLAAASPAVGISQGLIFVPVLARRGRRPGHGALVALSMRSGRVAWALPDPAGSESSPLVSGDTVYFGDQGGDLYSVRAATGHVNWAFHAAAAIKGGPALADGTLFFGDYAGRAYAVDAATGRQQWAVATDGAQLGFGSGQFYATPAVAFGRVYMGNTDGRVYSFAQRTGELAWATATGGYVYASAAVQDTPGLGPTVYLGSYDGKFYAFDARTGAVRWTHQAGGKISGSATIVSAVVYFSDLARRSTTGLDARTGTPVLRFADGGFSPVIADHRAIYVTGYHKLYELLPGCLRASKSSRPAAGLCAR